MKRIVNNRYHTKDQSHNEWITLDHDLEKLIDQAEFHRFNTFNLNGAYSPLEIKCKPIMQQHNRYNEVRISSSSINYVLLDEEPEIECPSLIIADKIEINIKIILRNTSKFPKRDGIATLCLLLFSPVVVLRVDERTNNSYSGALCGLCYDHKLQKPLSAENDIEEVFHCKFGQHDIDAVK